MNIPIYRAKKIDSDEYVVGRKDSRKDNILYVKNADVLYIKIDTSTISINFPDMVDSKNIPIFASLNKDRKGASLVKVKGKNKLSKFAFSVNDIFTYKKKYNTLQVIGIQK